jgi:hypothetical protein
MKKKQRQHLELIIAALLCIKFCSILVKKKILSNAYMRSENQRMAHMTPLFNNRYIEEQKK